jgi:hypothetical protein
MFSRGAADGKRAAARWSLCSSSVSPGKDKKTAASLNGAGRRLSFRVILLRVTAAIPASSGR